MNAGSRKSVPARYRLIPGPVSGGGAGATVGSAVMLPEVISAPGLLLVRGRGRRLELLLDPLHVVRVPEEVLEEAPLALPDGRAERRRLLIGHVERDVLRLRDRGGGRARRLVRVHA